MHEVLSGVEHQTALTGRVVRISRPLRGRDAHVPATFFCDHPRLLTSGGVRFERDEAGRRSLVFPARGATIIVPRSKRHDRLVLVTDRSIADDLRRWTFIVNDSRAEAQAAACQEPHADLYRIQLTGPPSYLARTTVLFRSDDVPSAASPGLRLYSIQLIS